MNMQLSIIEESRSLTLPPPIARATPPTSNAVTRICTDNRVTARGGPGAHLDMLFGKSGEWIDSAISQGSEWWGRGPISTAVSIEKYFGKGLDLEKKLDQLFHLVNSPTLAHNEANTRKAASKLQKLCSRVMKYTESSQPSETQILAFIAIIRVTTRYIGLRHYFVIDTSHSNKEPLTKAQIISKWTQRYIPENQEDDWKFLRTFAAYCVAGPDKPGVVPNEAIPNEAVPTKAIPAAAVPEAAPDMAARERKIREKAARRRSACDKIQLGESMAAVERIQPSSFGPQDNVLCISDYLLNYISVASEHNELDKLIAVRYLAGILEFPSFWKRWKKRSDIHSLSDRVCQTNIRLLEDLSIDGGKISREKYRTLVLLDPEGVEKLLLSTLNHLPLEDLSKDETNGEKSLGIVGNLVSQLQTPECQIHFPMASERAKAFLKENKPVMDRKQGSEDTEATEPEALKESLRQEPLEERKAPIAKEAGVKGGEYGTALQAACAGGYHKLAELLLDNGADVRIEGGKYGTALRAASAGNHFEVAELLRARGAEESAR
ncbi:hypothetical protein HWV62_17358 [Athelia sp. TMB]|nr:hypothetical protein HWV62_17358 [Athelia sp. TMB]